MLALGYVRVSTEDQARDGVSLQQQSDAIRRYAHEHDLTLHSIVTDANVSGGKPFARRKGGADLLERAELAKPVVIVTTYLDRLFRDTRDGLECMRRTFPRVDARVVCIYDALDLSTPAGRLNATMRLATAEFERELIADRAKRTNNALREQGRVFGTVPFGCIARDGHLYRSPDTWSVRQSIVELREQGHSFREIRARLRALRIPAPEGGCVWSPSSIQSVIRNHTELARLPLADAAEVVTN